MTPTPTSTGGVPTATPDRAITDLDKAIQLKPDHATAYFFRGNSYYHKGDYERAIAVMMYRFPPS